MPEEIPPGGPPETADVETTVAAAEKATESTKKATAAVKDYQTELNKLTKIIAVQTDAALALERARGKDIDSMDRAASILANQTEVFSKLAGLMDEKGPGILQFFDDELEAIKDNAKEYTKMSASEKERTKTELEHMREIAAATGEDTSELKLYIEQQGIRANLFVQEANDWKQMRGQILGLVGMGKKFSRTYTGALVGSILPLGLGIASLAEHFSFLKDKSNEANREAGEGSKGLLDKVKGSLKGLGEAATSMKDKLKETNWSDVKDKAVGAFGQMKEGVQNVGPALRGLGDKLKNLDKEDAKKGLKNIGKALVGAKDKAKDAGAGFAKLAVKLKPFSEALGGLVMGRLEEMIVGIDNTITGFMKATGATDDYKDAVYESVDALRQQGLDMTTAGAAAGALMQNTTLLRGATQDARTEMISFVAIMEQAGVASDISTKSLHVMNKVMGTTGPALTKEFEDMVHMAQRLGMSVSQVSQDFIEASRTLAAHGPKMKTVFKELTVQAAATGIATSRLLDIAAQFDTFEGAADAVGRLNGVLVGPYLNSIDMVYKTESQRNRAILESVRLSGLSFESMGRFEKKALAAAVGITDMAEAAAFFGTSLEAFDRAETKALENADAQKAMAKMAKDATGIFQNLQNTLNQMVVDAKPLIEFLRNLIYGFSKILSSGPGIIAFFTLLSIAVGVKLVTSFLALKASLIAAQVAAGPVYWTIAAIATAAAIAIGLIGGMSDPMKDMTKDMEKATKQAEKLSGALPGEGTGFASPRVGTLAIGPRAGAPVTDALVTEEGKVIPIDSKDRPYALGKPGGPVEAAVSSPGRPAAKEAAIPVHTATAIHNLVTNVSNNAKIAAQSTAAPQAARATQDTRPVVITVDGALLTRGVMTYVDGVKKARFLEGLPE